jgi:hypothetical protein
MLAESAASRRKAIEITADLSIPRLFVTLREAATGPGVAEALSRLYLQQPKLASIDKLYDLTAYPGVATHDDLLVIVDAYLKAKVDPRHPCRTAFVTSDPHFELWAKAMSHLFPGREHRAFAAREPALAFLDEPMDQRPPFTGD